MTFLGQDDGNQSLANARLVATTQVEEAQRRAKGRMGAGRWPGAGTVARLALTLIVAIVIIGWLLTALNR